MNSTKGIAVAPIPTRASMRPGLPRPKAASFPPPAVYAGLTWYWIYLVELP